MFDLYQTYRQVLEFIPYPIILYDENGYVTYVNPAFSNVFGWTLEEIKGRALDFVPENLKKETIEMLDRFRQNQRLSRYETRRFTKDGRMLDVVIWAASYTWSQDRSGEHFVILRDITEEKRLAANNQTIMRISAALPEYPELEDLMDYITREIKGLLKTEGAVVLLYDEIKNDLFFWEHLMMTRIRNSGPEKSGLPWMKCWQARYLKPENRLWTTTQTGQQTPIRNGTVRWGTKPAASCAFPFEATAVSPAFYARSTKTEPV